MNHNEFFNSQLAAWPDARKRYDDLQAVLVRSLPTDGVTLKVQCNPARIVSTGAKIDKATLAKRPCFLCEKNRPKEQMTGALPRIKNEAELSLLVNPFPILPEHFTLPATEHQPQLIKHAYLTLYSVVEQHPQLMVFYNGPKCGASCPDHLHLQAGALGVAPLQAQWSQLVPTLRPILTLNDNEEIAVVEGYVCPAIAIRSRSAASFDKMFRSVYDALPMQDDDTEPMMNILAWRNGSETIAVIIPRKKHRPTCYEQGVLISPGALDMAGLIITPRKEDFDNITANDAAGILREVCLGDEEMQQVIARIKHPFVSVGIVSANEIRFTLNASYTANNQEVDGEQCVTLSDNKILWNGTTYDELAFCPKDGDNSSFTLHSVTIGVNFHWQRQERQTFIGELRFIVLDGKICAINRLHVEDYLTSVISSEMSATSSLELLKAHAIISRSWLIAQIKNKKTKQNSTLPFGGGPGRGAVGPGRGAMLIRWYDHDDHTAFDVCADDHCQRYQGITKASSPHVREAIRQTFGQILMSGDEICDARFSKCCGGITEEYGYCWENIRKPYLLSVADPFCNTNDREVLSQVLNDYDQETNDFYRWDVTITKERVRQLLKEKLNIELGEIVGLEPVERGPSGRLSMLRFVGTERSIVIGKELEIRRALSDTHLYSSAFDIEDLGNHFVLHGKGWGHGVGLCQIGAAVMGAKGFGYDEILMHYYKNATIEKIY